MTFDTVFEMLNRQMVERENRPLTSAESIVLKGIWQGQTYVEIAQSESYSPGYLTTVVAPELFQRLSRLTERLINKKNCRVLLETYISNQKTVKKQSSPIDWSNIEQSPDFPEGTIPLESSFYIERSSIESQIYQELNKTGALVRIKAPREMGKTSMLLRLLDQAKRQQYRTADLNLELTDQAILDDLNRFLRWLCANVSIQLQLKPKLDDYWDEDIGSKISCTMYFSNYILKSIDHPLVLVIDEVNQIFEHPVVAKDVLPLLRSWHEEGKRQPIWQKLRLVVAHSTEIYVKLQLNQSPFNVGLPIQLDPFELEEIETLASRYGLNWEAGNEAQQLMALVGGHPSLVHVALYHLSKKNIPLQDLLDDYALLTDIYGYHLQRHLAALKEQPDLSKALSDVMQSSGPVQLEAIIAYKLSSMGLIVRQDNGFKPGCELYRRVFSNSQQTESIIRKRRRGVILTPSGLDKLNEAKQEAEFEEKKGGRFTLEELSERTGLSVDTLMRVQGAEVAVDKQTLKYCFRAFNLSFESSDYQFPDS